MTLQLKTRDVDLVIRDQNNMDSFLLYLINHLKTLDGKKDSALKLLDNLKSQAPYGQKKSYALMYRKIVYNKVLMKFKIMRIRSKISYIAFKKRMTISELIVTQILKSFKELHPCCNVEIQND